MVRPLYELQRDYMLSAERIHGGETTVLVLASTKTRTGRFWVYVRDDGPFKGSAPPAALFYYSPDRPDLNEAPIAELSPAKRGWRIYQLGSFRSPQSGRITRPMTQ